jgi:hypothetical protein
MSVTGRRGLYGCKMLWIPHFLDKGLKDYGEVVGLTRRPRLTREYLVVLIYIRG